MSGDCDTGFWREVGGWLFLVGLERRRFGGMQGRMIKCFLTGLHDQRDLELCCSDRMGGLTGLLRTEKRFGSLMPL